MCANCGLKTMKLIITSRCLSLPIELICKTIDMNKKLDDSIYSIFQPRKQDSHKGNHGHALILAGNKGKMGAAVIAAKACLRAGVGLLTVNIPTEERQILQIAIPEAMLVMRENENKLTGYAAACVGPGIGTDEQSIGLVNYFLTDFPNHLLLDADALNIIAYNHLFDKIKPNTILTPHPKEFDRLFGIHQSLEQRIEKAIEISSTHKLGIVLKDHHTIVTFCGEVYINNTGNAGLAKGGAGDALSGIICAFLAQGYNPFNAAKLGVYLHGLAADIALDKQSMESMLITDVIERLGEAFKSIMIKG